MLRTPDCTGQRFGRWIAVRRVENRGKKPHWECRCECGKLGVVAGTSLRRGASKSCGCWSTEAKASRRGPRSPGWRGGTTRSSTHYVLVQAPEHPAAHISGYVAEHRLVMEKTLGRYLTAEETVHHMNGIRHDNRPENLELWSSRQPKGQRVFDLVAWAKEILALYEGKS